ncbi:MAG: FAD-dependent oxidoreductase [Pseudoflavonifractor sp.]
MKKRTLAFLLSACMILSLAACAPAPAPTQTPAPGFFKAGTYTATADGRNGPVEVEVTFTADRMDAVTVKSHKETAGIADPALAQIPASIVEHQSLAVDAIAGCTITSNAILAAVTDCVTQAGGDVAALQAKEIIQKVADDETITTDVVIAGGGIAGLSAGIEALDAGAKVVLVEKMPNVGGSTSLSGGKILAANSYVQKALNIEDSPAIFADYLNNISRGKADPAFIQCVTESSAATVDWLVAHGVQLKNEVETPLPDMLPKRGLMALDDKGASFITPLKTSFEQKGGSLLLETAATELITDTAGSVVGLVATRADGSKLTVHAGAVVLATGGFTGNPELLEKYAPSYKVFRSNAGAGNTGDGLLMAERVGADIFAQDCLIAQLADLGPTMRFDAVGLYVSASGARFMNENLARPRKARASIEAIGKEQAYYIHDASEVTDKMAAALEAGTAFEADSLEALAGKIGADPAALTATVTRYNALCASGTDADFGKDAAAMKPISLDGKLYAIALKINTAGTTGGPRINLSAQVLKKDSQPIPGLYAAGEVASGSFFAFEYPGSGSAIQCYTTFGRIAGQNSAKEALSK